MTSEDILTTPVAHYGDAIPTETGDFNSVVREMAEDDGEHWRKTPSGYYVDAL